MEQALLQSHKARRTAVRSCVACRSSGGKTGFIRIVRGADGVVRIDPTGKAPGRGAYVCRSVRCVAAAAKGKRLDRALRAAVPAAVYDELMLGSEVAAKAEDQQQTANW